MQGEEWVLGIGTVQVCAMGKLPIFGLGSS